MGSYKIHHFRWFNQPQDWSVTEDQTLKMLVTPKTDYWRVTHYDFSVDDGPFFYTNQGGAFEVKVRIEGHYQSRYDQAGLMIRIDQEDWVKAGLEYVDGISYVSAVVTHGKSDWSIIELDQAPSAIWIKAVRHYDTLELFYSLDDTKYILFRLAYFPEKKPVMVGMTAASPDGEGFEAVFKHFEIKHIPDAKRLKWLQG